MYLMAKKSALAKNQTKKVIPPVFSKKTTAGKKIKELEKPAYFNNATIKCACGMVHRVGSTVKTMKVDVCSACHPFFTGSQKFIDIAGQVDKFKERLAKAEKMKAKSKRKGKNNG